MTEKIINELFEKKVDEFMEYQKHIKKTTKELCDDLFTRDVVEMIEEYTSVIHYCPATENLWLRNAKAKAVSRYYLDVEENPNHKNYAYYGVNKSRYFSDDLFYSRPKNLNDLKDCVDKMKRHERLIDIIRTDAPVLIKSVFEWKQQYMEDNFNYLNSLDFSLPEQKKKRYVITINIEEVEE